MPNIYILLYIGLYVYKSSYRNRAIISTLMCRGFNPLKRPTVGPETENNASFIVSHQKDVDESKDAYLQYFFFFYTMNLSTDVLKTTAYRPDGDNLQFSI